MISLTLSLVPGMDTYLGTYVPGISAVVESVPARLLSKDEDMSLQGSHSPPLVPPPGTAQSHLFTGLIERRTEMLLQHVLPFGGT